MKVKVTIEWDYTYGTSSADATKMTEEEVWEYVKILKDKSPVPGVFKVELL